MLRIADSLRYDSPWGIRDLVMAIQDARDTSLDEECDEDLLIFMSLRDDDPATAKSAWTVFHTRHARFVHGQCWRVFYQHLNGRYDNRAIREMAKDLAAEVMMRVFSRAETFKLRGSRDSDQMRRQVRAWLGTIARNMVRSWLSSGQYESGVGGIEGLDESIEDDGDRPPNPMHDCVRQLIDSLPDKERTVLLTYMQFLDLKTGTGRLSNEESKQLAERLGLTTASLRQIKRRVMQRLKPEIESKCLGKTSE